MTTINNKQQQEETNTLHAFGLLIVTIAVIMSIGVIIYAVYAFTTITRTSELNEAMTSIWNWGIAGFIILVIGKIMKGIGSSQLKKKIEEEEAKQAARQTRLYHYDPTMTRLLSAKTWEQVDENIRGFKEEKKQHFQVKEKNKTNSKNKPFVQGGITYRKE